MPLMDLLQLNPRLFRSRAMMGPRRKNIQGLPLAMPPRALLLRLPRKGLPPLPERVVPPCPTVPIPFRKPARRLRRNRGVYRPRFSMRSLTFSILQVIASLFS